MKKIFLFGVFALLSTTLFSCTADEFETTAEKTEAKKETILSNELNAISLEQEGPDDDQVNVKPPKK